jgi:serine/threonine protein kinase
VSLLVGRYRFIGPLGKGGMGTVWRAFDELLRQEVAVKEVRLPADLSAEARAELSERTLREARAAAKLRSHPSIVTVHDVIVDNDRPWIVMELVQGRSLDQIVRENGPLPPQQVANIGLALLDALSAAHGIGVLHRDVKPANVLLTNDGRVVLTDFGIATVAGDTSLTQAGHVAGSPGYIAPERLRGEPETPESDIWSLGATLYAAVEGHSPFARDNPAAIMAAVLMHEPGAMQKAGPLGPVLAGLLEKDTARRCPTAHAAAQLRAIASGNAQPTMEAAAAPPPRPPAPARQQSSGQPWKFVAIGAGALVAALAAGSVIWVLTTSQDSTPKEPLLVNGSPPSQPSRPSQAVFTEDPNACDLLEPSQLAAEDILGKGTKENNQGQTAACVWNRDDKPYSMTLLITRLPTADLASTTFRQQREVMKGQIRANRTTDFREARTAGDQTYSLTQLQQNTGFKIYRTDEIFTLSNLFIELTYLGPRAGYRANDKTANLVIPALGTPR